MARFRRSNEREGTGSVTASPDDRQTMASENLRLFDSHLHIIDPRFPLVANSGYLPSPYCVGDYLADLAGFERVGGCIVSGSFQGFDQSYLRHALKQLGSHYVGTTQLPADTSDQQILELDSAGVRGIRFNLKRGGSEHVRNLDSFARRVHEVAGWHVELYVDARELAPLAGVLCRLPSVSIDHLGLSGDGLPALLQLVEAGVRVKATGFGRLDFPADKAIRSIHAANPAALMFGTDLPSTRAPRPFSPADIQVIQDCLDPEAAARVMVDNALAFYRLQVT